MARPVPRILMLALLGALALSCRPSPQREADAALRLQLAGRQREAIARYESLLRRAPRLDGVRNNLGVARYLAAEYERALRLFLDEARDSRSGWPHFNAAIAMLRAKRWRSALAHLIEARRRQPKNATIALWLAIAQLRSGVALDPRLDSCEKLAPPIWLELGRDLLQRGARLAGRRCLQRALRRAPNDLLPHVLLALDAIAQREYREARRLLLAAVAALEKSGKREASLHALLGAVELSLSAFDAARRHCELALALDASNVDAAYWLGLTLLWKKEWSAAERAFRAALRHAPRRADALYGAALSAFRSRRYRQALDWLTRLAAIGPLPSDARSLRLDVERLVLHP